MENWLEKLFAGWGWEILSGIAVFILVSVIGFLWHRKPIREMRQELTELREWKQAREQTVAAPHERTRDTSLSEPRADADSVDFIGACAIVDGYIHLATHDMRDRVRLSVRYDIIERFGQSTGAMLGQGQYNSALLHQWMQSNAARFLVDHRREML